MGFSVVFLFHFFEVHKIIIIWLNLFLLSPEVCNGYIPLVCFFVEFFPPLSRCAFLLLLGLTKEKRNHMPVQETYQVINQYNDEYYADDRHGTKV